ncbi:hypothetical protein PAESOLCIP111_06537 [Paenibacillus solanacearum]|uniref:Uncharacterized protein n=1 Tax=Paenibacillus solanacearum TaxID=2048548 RepID=A0A916K9H2_9BACL|nr:hypothetical protein [Paenibacillus solanacearum]CAG7652440.1 hypothetical protein PAESOLCIP111_06537 [Paenibacillus solanacearum]
MSPRPLLTQDEFHNVKMSMILPVMLDVLQQDMKKMNQSKLRLDVVYIKSLDKAQECVLKELLQLKTEHKKKGIRIYEETRTPEGIRGKFQCRGYEHTIFLLWEKVRAEMLVKCSEYLQVSLTEGG